MSDDEKHEIYMRMAIAKAKEGIEKGQTPFGACIVCDGQVLSCAHNSVWDSTDITAHAEVQAIREACLNVGSVSLEGSVIYSTCEPCPMCFSACHWARIDKIFYGAAIEDAQAAGFHELTISNNEMKEKGESPVEIVPGFLKEEATELFQLWGQKEERRLY